MAKIVQKGRIGTALLIMGAYVTMLGASFIIRKKDEREDPEDEADKEIETYLDRETAPSSDSWNPLGWKRIHFLLCCLCLQYCILCGWEASYSSFFESNIYRVVFLSKGFHILLEAIITRALNEKLLCAPFFVTIGVTETLVMMGSSDFTEFTVLCFIQISMNMLHRLYIDPSIKAVQCLWPRLKYILVRKVKPIRRMTVAQKSEEERKWRKINEDIQARSEGVDPLIDAISLCSTNITTRLLSPFAFMAVICFYKQSEIAQHYNISADQLTYYMLFAMCMIPWSIYSEVLISNAQELIHGWRLYDYLIYQLHRYGSRDVRWTLNCPHFDESVTEPLQSIDLMNFSSQYYFIVSLLSCSMIITSIGGTILLRTKQYSFLSDPALPLIVLAVSLTCSITKVISVHLGSVKVRYLDWEGIWGATQIEGTLDDMIATKLEIGQRQADLDNERMELEALNNDKFRQRFLDRNRPWILRHLVDLFAEGSHALSAEERQKLTEYAKSVYTELQTMGAGDKRPGDRSDISSDSEDDTEMEKRREWDRATVGSSSQEIAKLWLSKARKRHRFAQAVRSKRRDYCSVCTRGKAICQSLSTKLCIDGKHDPWNLDLLIAQFEEDFPTGQNDLILWKSFFRQHAEYVTICDSCIIPSLVKSETKVETKRFTRPGDISSDDDNDEGADHMSFDPLVVDPHSINRQLVSKWLLAARRKLGGTFPRPGAKRFCQHYIESVKRKQQSSEKYNTTQFENKTQKRQGRQLGEWDPIKVDQSSKTIISRWLLMARDKRDIRIIQVTQKVFADVDNALAHIIPSNDWYFGEQLRFEGEELQRNGAVVKDQREERITKESEEVKEIQKTSDSYVTDLQCKLKLKEAEFEKTLDRLKSAHKIKADLRLRELENSLQSAPSEDRQRIELFIKDEEVSSKHKWEEVEADLIKALQIEKRLIERESLEKEKDAKIEINFVRQQYRDKNESDLSQWREKATRWLAIANRKIDSFKGRSGRKK